MTAALPEIRSIRPRGSKDSVRSLRVPLPQVISKLAVLISPYVAWAVRETLPKAGSPSPWEEIDIELLIFDWILEQGVPRSFKVTPTPIPCKEYYGDWETMLSGLSNRWRGANLKPDSGNYDHQVEQVIARSVDRCMELCRETLLTQVLRELSRNKHPQTQPTAIVTLRIRQGLLFEYDARTVKRNPDWEEQVRRCAV